MHFNTLHLLEQYCTVEEDPADQQKKTIKRRQVWIIFCPG